MAGNICKQETHIYNYVHITFLISLKKETNQFIFNSYSFRLCKNFFGGNSHWLTASTHSRASYLI